MIFRSIYVSISYIMLNICVTDVFRNKHFFSLTKTSNNIVIFIGSIYDIFFYQKAKSVINIIFILQNEINKKYKMSRTEGEIS